MTNYSKINLTKIFNETGSIEIGIEVLQSEITLLFATHLCNATILAFSRYWEMYLKLIISLQYALGVEI